MTRKYAGKARMKPLVVAALVSFVLAAGIGGLFAPPLQGSGGCCGLPIYSCIARTNVFCVNEDDCQDVMAEFPYLPFECCFSAC